jgi:SpoVK/Ycf46/Vps4 family AAA+-type ATPase
MTINKISPADFNVSLQGGPDSSPTSSLWMSESATGKNPHLATASLIGKIDIPEILKGHGTVTSSTHYLDSGYRETLCTLVDGTLIFIGVLPSGAIDIKCSGSDVNRVDRAIDRIVRAVTPLPKLDNQTTRVKFWYHTHNGPNSRTREIAIPLWSDIKGNYSQKATQDLEELMSLDYKTIGNGRILLMHGPPGGGKTTAIRALCNAWKPWCESEYVVDPEMAFGEAEYLIQLLLNSGSEDMEGNKGQAKWRLLIMEDAEEFLKPGAKKEVGQSVARLLNFGDGLLGQGLNVLVLMTTNVEINELHEAITRPGRCLSNIRVPKLSKEEATKWMGSSHEEATLAELFEAKTASQIGAGIEQVDISRVGTYL